MVHFAMEAAERIERELGKRVRVVDMHTIKPLDRAAFLAAAETGRVVAAQDHNLLGGLGQLVGAAIAEAGISCRLLCRGCPDAFVPIATPEFLYALSLIHIFGQFQKVKRTVPAHPQRFHSGSSFRSSSRYCCGVLPTCLRNTWLKYLAFSKPTIPAISMIL